MAEGIGNALMIEADAKYYAIQKKAEGDLYEQMKIAEGHYEQMRREAEGLEKKSEALRKLVSAYGDPHNYIMSRMIDE